MNLRSKFARRSAVALVAMCFLPITSWADDASRLHAIVDAAIRPVMAEHRVPGMAVALTIDGQAHYFNYGYASVQGKTPVSETTLFEVGSISKVLTATLASYAEVTGKLSLKDHPGKFMPQLKGSAIDKATLLHLGTYTAGGLPLQFPDEVTNAGMANYFRQWQADDAPGAQRTYSNPSLSLFGYLSARALKRDFSDAMEQLVLPQLGLKRSHIRVPRRAMASYAWGYTGNDQARRMSEGVLAAQSYGVKSGSADMIRFLQVNIEPGLLAGPMRRAVEGTQVGYFKVGNMVQGLGWEQHAFPTTAAQLLADMKMEAQPAQPITSTSAPSGPALFYKTGSTGGFGNYVAFVPQHKIGIVLLANKNLPIAARVSAAHAILEQITRVAQ